MPARVALLTEGTYPLHTGGVSVWCDQLVCGLGDIDFQVVALSGVGSEVRCALPPNVRQVSVIPLWDHLPARRAGVIHRAAFRDRYAQLLTAMLSDAPDATAAFTDALQGLSRLALRGDLSAALADPGNAHLLLQVWQGSANTAPDRPRASPTIPRPSVTDALDAAMWLAHLLRPLGHPLPGCDLTHAVSNGLSVLPAIAAKGAYGTPFILTEHGMYLRERYLTPPSQYLSAGTRAFLLRFYRHLTRAAYQVADLISPASNFNTRWQLHFGADARKLRPVYNGIDPELFTGGDSEPDTPTVAWVGRIDPIKDLSTLIRAHALLQHHLPDAQLRMFGPIPQGNEAYEQACRQLIHDLGLDAAAHFEGRVPSVAQAYQSGHVVALSSISEGFPYSVIEAMAAGRAMVATDVGGVREAVGDTGFVVPPRDPRAFAEACQELLRDDALRRRLSQRARDRVLTLFTLQHCIDAYRAMYAEVLAPDRLTSAPLPAAVGG
jgi:glycosyltransferase involved in cell wall biosynthesis